MPYTHTRIIAKAFTILSVGGILGIAWDKGSILGVALHKSSTLSIVCDLAKQREGGRDQSAWQACGLF